MRADLIKISESNVQLKTDYGIFHCNWMSDRPIDNAAYLIEINCDTIRDSNQIQLSPLRQPSISDLGDCFLINGLVEEIEDNLIFLRLSYNLIMIEFCCDIRSVRFKHQWVSIKVYQLNVYGELIQ